MEAAPDFSRAMQPQEAEEFMALLIDAQSTKHKCHFQAYFKKDA